MRSGKYNLKGINMNQKRKARKAVYMKQLRNKLVTIIQITIDHFYGDTYDGYDIRGMCYTHLTNFSLWQREIYIKAVSTWKGPDRFGISNYALYGDIDEGTNYQTDSMNALFISTRTDLSAFWDHFRKVEAEIQRIQNRNFIKRNRK